ELSGQRNLLVKLEELGIDYPFSAEEIRDLLQVVKQKESEGFQYEGAEASFELLVRRTIPGYTPPFDLEDFVLVQRRRHYKNGGEHNDMLAEVVVKIRVGGELQHTVAE